MKPLFADTSFFIAFLFEDDADHARAKAAAADIRSTVVTTRWILAEVGNYLRKESQRGLFFPFVQRLKANPRIQILPADDDSFDAGLELYAIRGDKAWSLTDCISFAIMNQLNLSDALTTDHHYIQSGFNALLT